MNINERPLDITLNGRTYQVNVVPTRYNNDRIALELVLARTNDDREEYAGQRFTIATLNLPAESCDLNQVYVKDYSECAGMVEWLKKHDIIHGDAVSTAQAGFVQVSRYNLTARVFAIAEQRS